MATRREVEAKLRELISRLDGAEEGVDALARALPQSRIIEVDITDLGQVYWSQLSGGRMGPLKKGRPEQSNIRIVADSDDLVDMVDGKRSLFSSYIGGRVKVEANLSDIMRLRKLT